MKKLISAILVWAVLVSLVSSPMAAEARPVDEVERPVEVMETPLGEDVAAEVPALPAEPPADSDELPAQLAEGERTVVASGSCGTNVTWTFYSDGELRISGTGAMANYSSDYLSSRAPWYTDHRNQITSVVIDSGVTSIGHAAFYDCSALTSVIIPEGVTEIGDLAFYGCSSLTSVTLPNSLTSIGGNYYHGGAFQNCSSLTSITIPGGVTSIELNAFSGCSALTSITIPDSVTSIREDAFYGCSKLTTAGPIGSGCNIEFGWTTQIPANAFSGCSSLTYVVIPEGVTSIRDDAFQDCSALTSVVIPKGVTSIGRYAFSGCSALVDVLFSGSTADRNKMSIGSNNDRLTSTKWYYIQPGAEIYPISVEQPADGHGTITTMPRYLCAAGMRVVIGGLPENGYRLTAAQVDGVPVEGFAFTATGSHTVSARFEPYKGNSVVASGSCGENVTWTFYSDGELRISGLGAMEDYYESSYVPWYTKYREQITSVVIDSGVTSIGDSAFYGCSKLTSANIPEGVTSIGYAAFSGCSSLVDITLPSSLLSIGGSDSWADEENGAFSGCSALTSIVIPEGVTSIGNYAFYGCSSLTSIVIPEGVTTICLGTFSRCAALIEIALPNSLTTIEGGNYYQSGAFYGCSALTSITIPKGVTSIEGYAFSDCSALTSVVCPAGFISIKERAFDGCPITYLVLPKAAAIGNSAFSRVRDVFFPGTEADRQAMTIDASNTVLLNAQWYYLSSRDEILTITAQAADHGTVVISDTMCVAGKQITVAGRPEAGYRLKAVLVDGQPIAGNTFVASASHVVTGDFELYKTIRMVASGACGANVFWYLYEDGELYITGTGAMENYSNYNSSYAPWYDKRDQITSVVIDNGVTAIGTYAFSGCSALTSVNIPEDITSIKSGTFSGCSSLTGVTLPRSLTSIEGGYNSGAFQNCSSLTSVNIPVGVTSIGHYAFSGCSALTSVNIPEGVTSIGGAAFYGCSALTSVTIPEGVTSIGGSAFYGCSALASVIIPEGVTSIGGSAFYGCSALTSVVIPEGVTSIENGAFRNCSALASVTLPHSLISIDGDYYSSGGAFSYCSSLTSITIPENVNSIGYGAFYDCSSLTTVEFLGDAPTTVGSDAFPSGKPGEFLIQYHQGKTGWTTPKWEGYYTECVDAVKDYSALNAENRNTQNILFVLNEDSNTATVGDNSTDDNNAGYNGSSGGVATIPDIVTKNGKSYRVIGINQQAFSENQMLKTVALGKNISSVEGSAFQRCPSFTAFTVPADSTRYSARSGILFDKMGAYLYVYPSGKSGEKYTVPASVTTIGNLAFSGNLKLSGITVGSTVTAIGAGAFSGCDSLEEITLPFIGASLTNNNGFKSVFNNNWNGVPKSLKTVTITGGKLANDDRTWSGGFSGCEYIEHLILPANDTFIPRDCFENCHALKSIVFTDTAAASQGLPEGHVILPKRITKIGEDAFYGCTSLKFFEVDRQNTAYCSDQWGVLYTKDQSTLIAYPSARKWPYYNVSDRTTSISRYAFYQCSNLVNLYIPRTVKTLESQCIYSCPGLTVCVYQGSPADVYAGSNSLTAWYMDNYVLQGLEIYSLPEQQAFRMGSEDFSGLYLAANGGKALQADGYTLSYDPNRTGLQTVTVSYQGLRASFPILLYGATDQLLDFGGLDLPDGATAYAAVYHTNGKMTRLAEVTVLGGKAQLAVPKNVYDTMGEAKLFVLQNGSFVPLQTEVTISR